MKTKVIKRKIRKNYIILISILLLIFIITSFLSATRFYFSDEEGDIYNIQSFVKQQVYLDEKLQGYYDYKYVGKLEVIDKIGTSSKLHGHYYAYSKPNGSSKPYELINEETSETEYIRKKNGKMVIDRSYLFPTVRDLPVFPDRDIKIGEEWESEALEVLDLTSLGANEPYRIPLSVLYKYLGDEKFKEKDVAVFSVKYYFEYDMFEKPNPNSDDTRPIFLTGLFEGKYYWDKTDNAPLFYDANTVFTFLLKNSQVLELRTEEYGQIDKITIDKHEDVIKRVDEDRKNEIKEDIEEELIDEDLSEDFNVYEKDEGVAINLGDILFDFNSYKLKPESIAKLDKIAKILLKYDNFSMIIEGHTDSIGTDDSNQILSENRAKSVEDYLIQKGIEPESLISMGYGESEPIASNETEEGRQLNRRVEITIITNQE
jgi:outer membrane protein OmpA-like peptidoglycan-associated protein